MQKYKKYQNRKRGESKKANLGGGGWSRVFHKRSIDSLNHKTKQKTNKTPNLILRKKTTKKQRNKNQYKNTKKCQNRKRGEINQQIWGIKSGAE